MSVFLQALRDDFRTRTPFVIWVLMTVIVGLAGPFGTYANFDIGHRMVFWAVIVGLCIGIGSMARALVFGTFRLRGTLKGAVLIACLLALVLPLFIYRSIALLLGAAYQDVPTALELSLFIFFTSLGISAFRIAISAATPAVTVAAQPAPQQPANAVPRLIRRLPPELRGNLISMSVRDHYVDVSTNRGRASLLMRLGDAVAEVDGVEGAQIHRSHWVAWSAVAGTELEAGKLTLTMQDGSRLPVSRPYRDLVAARGFGMARAAPAPQTMARAPGPNSGSNAGSSAHSPPV